MNLSDLPDDTEMAAALGCTPETVQARALAGELPGVKFGRGWVFPREAVLEALNRAARLQAEARATVKITAPAGVAVVPAAPAGRRRAPVALPSLPSSNPPF
jgi:excisionase family DNA binding protein